MTTPEFDYKSKAYSSTNAYLCSCAALYAYNDGQQIEDKIKAWNTDRFHFFDTNATQAFLCGNSDYLILSFRGTEPTELQDILTDLEFRRIKGVFGRVHKGFHDALNEIWDELLEVLDKMQDNNQKLFVTGHSLGAALATLASARLRVLKKGVAGVYTFGSPRVGNRDFAKKYNKRMKKINFRHVNNNDIVTRVPMRSLGFSHVGSFCYYESDGDLKHQISSWWLFVDRIAGRFEDLGNPLTDGIKDHSMVSYNELAEKNM